MLRRCPFKYHFSMWNGEIINLIYFILVSKILAQDYSNKSTLDVSINMFTLDFYKTLAQQEGNILCSPLSAYASLSMVYQGSRGETKRAFETSLHIPLHEEQFIAEAFDYLIKHFEGVENVSVAVANRLYLQQGLTLKDTFKSILKDKFNSGMEMVDFRQPEYAVKTINNFITDKTENKITRLFTVDDFKKEMFLVLVNTIYFKGQWKVPFYATRSATFHLNNHETVDVFMMGVVGTFNGYFRSDLDASVLKLPFTNENFTMLVILPRKVDGLKEVENKLSYEVLVELMYETKLQTVTVQLPRFKIEQEIDLRMPLEKLGLGLIFDESRSDLGSMVENTNLYVSKAVQKSYISVDEKGCEAAAASALGSAPRTSDFSFKAEHPFIFAIVEQSEQRFNVLFIGRVSNPAM